MQKIGITGGIGSGKTTVCKIFEALGIPVYYADERAKWLMTNDEGLIRQIKELFGENAYDEDGKLDRKYIAGIVFENEKMLEKLNKLVHPAVGRDLDNWHKEQKNVPYTLYEAALIYESGSHEKLDRVVVVSAPEELRIKRVMDRDQVDRERVVSRMNKQMPESKKVGKADYVIINDGNHPLIRQVLDIHRQLKRIAENDKK